MKAKDHFEMVPLASVADNPFQVGYPPDEPDVVKAAYQIRDQGLTFPLLVRPWGKMFQLASGQRWLSACRMLGVQRVPALIRQVDDRAMATLAFEEASVRGTLAAGHASILLDATASAWIANLLQRLRGGEEGFRVQVDAEAARNLPVPQQMMLAPGAPAAAAPPSPAETALVLTEGTAGGPVPPPVERGIHDTLLGVRCRHLPVLWFQTVSEPGRRWVLESMSSAGLIELSALGGVAGTFAEASRTLREQAAKHHPGGAVTDGPSGEKGRRHLMEIEVLEKAPDLKHKYVLLWQPGRALVLHLSNAPRFFLYDLKGFQEMVDASELI